MTLRHMKIFVAVCECKSVTAAAKKLFITQPAASLAITELEDYYGVRLFDRISKRLHITEMGKQLLSYATHIVSLFDEAEKSIRNLDSIGILRVGTSITIGNYLLPNFVKKFQDTHRNIKINAIIDNSKNIEDLVLRNEIDLGLIEGFSHSEYIESKIFMTDRMVLICSPDHAWSKVKEIEISDLNNSEFILRENGSAGREIIDNIFEMHGININQRWQSLSTQAIIKAVSKNLGISALPYLLVKENLDRGEVVEVAIKNITLIQNFSIINHKNKFLTNSAKDFMALCLN